MPFPILLAIQLGITAGAWGLNWLHKKTHQRPFPKPRPEGLEFAQATIGSPLPLVYGTIRVNEPVMTWHGNHGSVELTSSGRPGTFAYSADLLYVAGVPSWDEAAAPYSNWRTTKAMPPIQKMAAARCRNSNRLRIDFPCSEPADCARPRHTGLVGWRTRLGFYL